MANVYNSNLALRTSRKGKRAPLASISPPEDEEELRLVMQEIADALGANEIVLSIEGVEGTEILRVACTGLEEAVVRDLHAKGLFLHDETADNEHRWKSTIIDGTTIAVMSLPVKRMIGHRLMVISALFVNINMDARVKAERAYLARRPFAVGYFRLWQLDRVRQRREKALESAFNSVQFGIVLIDVNTSIVFANSAAADLFTAADGIEIQAGRIHATNLKDWVRLRAALDYVVTGSTQDAAILSLTRETKLPLMLTVVPLEWDQSENDAVAAVLHIIDPVEDLTNILIPLCHFYKLSSIEASLTTLLVSGLSLSEASKLLKLKEQTARGVLKQIFLKTGVVRQSGLVRIFLLNLPKTNKSTNIKIF